MVIYVSVFVILDNCMDMEEKTEDLEQFLSRKKVPDINDCIVALGKENIQSLDDVFLLECEVDLNELKEKLF